MGFETDVSVDITLRQDAPDEVAAVLEAMAWLPGPDGLWEKTSPDTKIQDGRLRLPEHRFFSCPRWFFTGFADAHCRRWDPQTRRLRVEHASFKNYDREIDHFLNWITPYCAPQEQPILTSRNEDGFCQDAWADGRQREISEDL